MGGEFNEQQQLSSLPSGGFDALCRGIHSVLNRPTKNFAVVGVVVFSSVKSGSDSTRMPDDVRSVEYRGKADIRKKQSRKGIKGRSFSFYPTFAEENTSSSPSMYSGKSPDRAKCFSKGQWHCSWGKRSFSIIRIFWER